MYYKISRRVGDAIGDYQMIRPGDRILVAVSGGKDSMVLLEMLRYRQRFSPARYEILAVWVDMGIPDFPAEQLTEYFRRREIPFLREPADILQGGRWEDVNCHHCAGLRRKRLFQTADRLGFNKIAFGHHLDDIAETILLNMCFRAEIGAMCPRQEIFGGRITIIRPLAYVPEEDIQILDGPQGAFSFKGHACPNDRRSKRVMFKEMIKRMEQVNPGVKKNILNSLRNIKTDYLL